MGKYNYNEEIKSYKDLDVYQRSYKCSIALIKDVLQRLPVEERYDLKDQARRSCKAIPRLIAEGYAKRHQFKGFQRYLVDAMGETNETFVCIEHCIDLYASLVDLKLCKELLAEYDIIGRQLTRLCQKWERMKSSQH